MPPYQQGDERISDGVNLLISILVRYPEVGTIRFDPLSHSLKLTFMFSGIPAECETTTLQNRVLDSIHTYHLLIGEKANSIVQVHISAYEQVTILTVIRDVYTFTKGEIALLIALLREQLKDRLITDQNDVMPEEDLLIQEELIENMLENVKRDYAEHSLIGIREDGRVLVFNK